MCLGIKVPRWWKRRFGLVPQQTWMERLLSFGQHLLFYFRKLNQKKKTKQSCSRKFVRLRGILGRHSNFFFFFFFATVHMLFPPLKAVYSANHFSWHVFFYIYIFASLLFLFCDPLLNHKTWTWYLTGLSTQVPHFGTHFSTSESWSMILQPTVIIELINNNEKKKCDWLLFGPLRITIFCWPHCSFTMLQVFLTECFNTLCFLITPEEKWSDFSWALHCSRQRIIINHLRGDVDIKLLI